MGPRHSSRADRRQPRRTGRMAGLGRGLTLLELVVVMAVLAVLGAMAVPGMSAHLRSGRLVAAAELMAADIADARHEAARRGQTLHVGMQLAGTGSPSWCWAVATTATCPCGASDDATAPTCRLKVVPATDHPGVQLVQAGPVRMHADGQADPVLAAVFTAGDRRIEVHVSRFGRARVCDPSGRSARVAKC
ncbi:MAG: prepilin-type N-terminal cleavage/methylation domain-containing protein [Rubrivivax sp.]|nr:prepilin-type N-terminal cleavage/methylation domain-containing protein [Rubrivivax sp.]